MHNLQANALGTIVKDPDLDQYGNKTSTISLKSVPHRTFSLVHFTPKKRFNARRTHRVWLLRGSYLPVETYFTDNDCAENWVKVAGFHAGWGDGENLGVYYNDKHADEIKAELGNPHRDVILGLLAKLREIHEDDSDAVILTVLDTVFLYPDFWTYKEGAEPPNYTIGVPWYNNPAQAGARSA